jgi:hypothetical protein
MRLTFKNQASATGLAAVGEGTPSIDIRINGVDIGVINFNDSSTARNWHTGKYGINVGFDFIATERELERNPNAKCHLHYVGRKVDGKFERAKFESGEAAMAWVRANIDRFLPEIYIETKAVAA